MNKLIEQIEDLKAITGKEIQLLSCGENFLSNVNEYHGCKVQHLPNSTLFPEQNNTVYLIPIESDLIVTHKINNYEIVEDEVTKEFEALKRWYVSKEEANELKKYFEETYNIKGEN